MTDDERQELLDTEHLRLLPYGTALGVFTFLVMGRPSVAVQFHG